MNLLFRQSTSAAWKQKSNFMNYELVSIAISVLFMYFLMDKLYTIIKKN